MKNILITLVIFSTFTACNRFADFDAVLAEAAQAGEPARSIYDARELTAAKNRLFEAAEFYRGEGDPDFEIQDALQPLVDEVLRINPQVPVVYRLDELNAVWEQVWGPYDNQGNNRGVDPEQSIDELYQKVNDNGTYYNVAPRYEDGDLTRESIALLQGQYSPVDIDSNMVQIRFRSLNSVDKRPEGYELWDLPELFEADELDGVSRAVPRFVVRNFFPSGYLREVYSDSTMRISYGISEQAFGPGEYLFVMRKVETD